MMEADRHQIREILRSTARLRPLDYLANRTWRTAVVADATLYDHVAEHFRAHNPGFERYNTMRFLSPLLARLSGRLRARPQPLLVRDSELNRLARTRGIRSCIVCSLGHEQELQEAVQQVLPGCKVQRLVADVLTWRAAKAERSHLGRREIEQRSASRQTPSRAYAIVCTPRSGSTFLADLLGRNGGLGRPDEHLKNSVVALYRHRETTGFDFERWLDLVLAAHTVDDVFATKLISNFLFTMNRQLAPRDREVLFRCFQDSNPKLVYLVRSNKAAQAVSAYVANQTRVWHLKDPKGYERARQTEGRIHYDFEAIHRIYNRLQTQERRLAALVSDSGLPCLRVVYEDLTADVAGGLAGIVRWLDPDRRTAELKLESGLERVSARLGHEVRERFAADLARFSE